LGRGKPRLGWGSWGAAGLVYMPLMRAGLDDGNVTGMALSPAEKQRRYRARQSPDARQPRRGRARAAGRGGAVRAVVGRTAGRSRGQAGGLGRTATCGVRGNWLIYRGRCSPTRLDPSRLSSSPVGFTPSHGAAPHRPGCGRGGSAGGRGGLGYGGGFGLVAISPALFTPALHGNSSVRENPTIGPCSR
jgi:hypothetical protein